MNDRDLMRSSSADRATQRAECWVEPGDGHRYRLVVYDAHHDAYEWASGSMPARTERRLLFLIDDDQRGDFIASDPEGHRRLPPHYTLVEEQTREVDGIEYGIAYYTDDWDPGDPEGTLARRIALITRKGESEWWPYETGAGYIRQKEYVPPPAPPQPDPPTLTPDTPREQALRCPDCEEWAEEGDEVRLYECGTCGQTTSERRCENCNLFAAKLTDEGCPSCEGAELERVEAVRDEDGQLWAVAEVRGA